MAHLCCQISKSKQQLLFVADAWSAQKYLLCFGRVKSPTHLWPIVFIPLLAIVWLALLPWASYTVCTYILVVLLTALNKYCYLTDGYLFIPRGDLAFLYCMCMGITLHSVAITFSCVSFCVNLYTGCIQMQLKTCFNGFKIEFFCKKIFDWYLWDQT